MKDYPNPGATYRHYKGGLYEVLFLSKHTENDEVLVNYKSLHFGSFYSRPIDSWNQTVKSESGNEIKRFKLENDNCDFRLW